MFDNLEDFELGLKTNIFSKSLPEEKEQNIQDNQKSELSNDLSNWALRNKICHSPLNDLLELLSSSTKLKGISINRVDFSKNINTKRIDESTDFSNSTASHQKDISSFMNAEGMTTLTPFEKLVLEELRGIKQHCSQLDLTLSEVKGNQQYLQNQLESYISEQNIRREADTGMLRNSAAILAKLNQTVKKLTGDEAVEVDEEVGFMFPIKSIEEMFNLESRLESEYFSTSLLTYLKRKKAGKKFEAAFRSLAEDNVYSEFNVDGRCGKRRLLSLKLFDVILYKAYASEVSRNEYDHELRSCIFRSHNRFNRAKCTAHKRLKRLESPVPSTSSEK